MKKLIAIFFILCLLGGCAKPEDVIEGSDTPIVETPDTSSEPSDMFTERDKNESYSESDSVSIELDGTTAKASAQSVKISGGTVTITDAGTYVVSGTLSEGMLVIDAGEKDKPHVILDNASITSKTCAALYIKEADKVVLTLAENSENTLQNGGTFTAIDDNNIDGALFSKQDLSLNGVGALEVISPAGHGIVCKDDLVLAGGSITVNAASHALDVNDSVRLTGDTALSIKAGKDGIHCENTEDSDLGFIYAAGGKVKVEAEGDGLDASAYIKIEDGAFDLLIGGGSANGQKASSDHFGGFMGGKPNFMPTTTDESATSMKGIKAAGNISVSGGTFKINSADDGVHSDTSLTVSGGSFDIATGDDGFHAEQTLTLTAGDVTITESYEGLEALDIKVQGGTISLVASDDGLNAAGGNDQSGTTGGRDGMFGAPGGMGGGPGGRGGAGGMSSSNGSIVISGGTLKVQASGDGIDANGTLEITGGHTTVEGPSQGDTATLDYDKSATISGGTFIGTGGAGMAQSFSQMGQGVIAVNVGNVSANTAITLKDGSKTLLNHTPSLPYAVVIFSSPDIQSGKSYTLTIGSNSAPVTAR